MAYEKERDFLIDNLNRKKIKVGELQYFPNCKVFSYEILLPPDEDEPYPEWKNGFVRLTSVKSWIENQGAYHLKYKTVVNNKCFLIVCDEKKKPIEPEHKTDYASLFEDDK